MGKDDRRNADPVEVKLGERIRAARYRRGMSLSDLAAKLGVKSPQVQKYETGIDRLSASRLYAIAGTLDTPIGVFLDDVNAAAHPAEIAELGNRISESVTLNLAFLKIVDRRFRRHIVDLIQSIADAGQEQASPKGRPEEAD